MVALLWLLCYGCFVMVVLLWLLCYGCFVMVALFSACFQTIPGFVEAKLKSKIKKIQNRK
jgi:hypothetical protein